MMTENHSRHTLKDHPMSQNLKKGVYMKIGQMPKRKRRKKKTRSMNV